MFISTRHMSNKMIFPMDAGRLPRAVLQLNMGTLTADNIVQGAGDLEIHGTEIVLRNMRSM